MYISLYNKSVVFYLIPTHGVIENQDLKERRQLGTCTSAEIFYIIENSCFQEADKKNYHVDSLPPDSIFKIHGQK